MATGHLDLGLEQSVDSDSGSSLDSICYSLQRNWYAFELSAEIEQWILECLAEQIDFVQPYDNIYLRAKRTLTGKPIYKVVFSAVYQDHYNFPVCYLLNLNTGKFKGNRMHYCIDGDGTHYSDRFPVYNGHFKFRRDSKYCRESKQLWSFLNKLDVPEAVPSSKEKRYYQQRERQKHRERIKRCRWPRHQRNSNWSRDIIVK